MAIIVTNLTSGGASGTASSDTTASISPTGNSLLIVNSGTLRNSGVGVNSISDTLTGTSAWTQITVIGATSKNRASIFYAITGATPGSGTITINYSLSPARRSWVVNEITGINTSAPVTQSNSDSNSSSTMTVTLGSSLASGSIAYGMVNSDTSNVTVGGSETEITEYTSGDSPQANTQTEYYTTNALSWGNLGTTYNNTAIVLEIAEAVGGITRRIMSIS